MEKRQAQISLLSAFRGFFYLFFGRIPYQILGLVIFSLGFVTIITFNQQIKPLITSQFARFDSLHLPISIETIVSPEAKKITQTDLFEAQGLIKTPSGYLSFSKKINMFSTSYDKNCQGCSNTTASGLPTGYGVVAVDPKVVPLGTRLYIPGYGVATAGDTGGNIKGHKIDLGFDNVKYGWWSARFVDVYVLE